MGRGAKRSAGKSGKKKKKGAPDADGASVNKQLAKMSRIQRRHLREYGELHPVMAAERDQVASNALRSTTTDAVSHSSKRRRVDENVTRKDRQRRVAFASDDEREQPEEEEEDEYGEDAFAALISAPSAVSLNSKALRKQRQADEREADITAKAVEPNSDNGEEEIVELTEAELAARAAELGDGYEIVPAGDSDASGDDDNVGDAADSDSDEDDDIESADSDSTSDDTDAVTDVGEDGRVFAARYGGDIGSESFGTIQAQIDLLKKSKGRKQTRHSRVLDARTGDGDVTVRLTGCTSASPSKDNQLVLDGVYKPPEPELHARLFRRDPLSGAEQWQQDFLGHLSTYCDFFWPLRTPANHQQVMRCYAAHALNHVLKTRAMILRNSAKIKQDEGVEIRDQGFSRAKVLILLPYKWMARIVIEMLLEMAVDEDAGDGTGKNTVRNRGRFNEEFCNDDEDDSDGAKHPNAGHRFYFGENADDCFRIGLSFTRTTVNLYSDFYYADVIVASPLGLRLIIGAEGERSRDFDFLSSIEVLIVDQAESFLMQNWAHFEDVVAQMNQVPTQPRETDFSRVRQWSLEGLAPHFRQTCVFSAFCSPEIRRVLKTSVNYAGSVEVRPTFDGAITAVPNELHQAFHKIDCDSVASSADDRFHFFIEKVLPEFSRKERSHVLIYIPSYFDFVRLRNHLRREEISFGQICEYTSGSNVSRARSYLYHGNRTYTLYTERYHYHFRPRLRGIKHIVFYGLPQFAEFYPELLGYIVPDDEVTVTSLYTRYDALALQRIVGSTRAAKMLAAEANVHLFV